MLLLDWCIYCSDVFINVLGKKKSEKSICDTITSCVMNVLGLVMLNKKEEEEESSKVW
jgi:hypothetical protein